MLEMKTRFTPADGSAPRIITARICDPVKEDVSWSVLMEITGFDETFSRPTYGADWAQAIHLAAMILPITLQRLVGDAGGGTLEPSFYERGPQLADLPPEVADLLRRRGERPN